MAANTNSITVAAPIDTNAVTQFVLAYMAGLTGVATDYNVGSQLRTMVEAQGAVVEQQGVTDQARALQGLTYGAMSIFGITPNAAVPAVGIVTFSAGAPLTQSVQIPQGTIVQTPGGVQFITTIGTTILAGQTSITVPVQAVVGGTAGNVSAGQVSQLASSLTFPLSVTNVLATAGGLNAEAPSQALARLAAKVNAIGLGSPVSISNFVIGISNPGTTETVQYATCYEPWAAAGTGAVSGLAGYDVYIDNGTGTASTGLITAVTAALNGNLASGQPGNRPAGVPYSVLAVSGIFANVTVVGSVNLSLSSDAIVSGAVATAITSYFSSLAFGVPAEQAQISSVAGNAALGVLTSLTVTLAYSTNSAVSVTEVSGQPYSRVILNLLSVTMD